MSFFDRRYVIFSASDELPSDVEEALLFWVNKTCQASSSRDDDQGDGRSGQKVFSLYLPDFDVGVCCGEVAIETILSLMMYTIVC